MTGSQIPSKETKRNGLKCFRIINYVSVFFEHEIPLKVKKLPEQSMIKEPSQRTSTGNCYIPIIGFQTPSKVPRKRKIYLALVKKNLRTQACIRTSENTLREKDWLKK